jgi:hypothetical protein
MESLAGSLITASGTAFNNSFNRSGISLDVIREDWMLPADISRPVNSGVSLLKR